MAGRKNMAHRIRGRQERAAQRAAERESMTAEQREAHDALAKLEYDAEHVRAR